MTKVLKLLTKMWINVRIFPHLCGRHVIRKGICYVSNWRILEYSQNLSPFFFKTSKTETATQSRDSWFQISNFEIRQIAFLMTCRPHKMIKSNPKVHSFLKQCLHDLCLTQKVGHFQQTFSCCYVERFFESTTFLCHTKIVQTQY